MIPIREHTRKDIYSGIWTTHDGSSPDGFTTEWTVPTGVDEIEVYVWGGSHYVGIHATVSVEAGQTYDMTVGGASTSPNRFLVNQEDYQPGPTGGGGGGPNPGVAFGGGSTGPPSSGGGGTEFSLDGEPILIAGGAGGIAGRAFIEQIGFDRGFEVVLDDPGAASTFIPPTGTWTYTQYTSYTGGGDYEARENPGADRTGGDAPFYIDPFGAHRVAAWAGGGGWGGGCSGAGITILNDFGEPTPLGMPGQAGGFYTGGLEVTQAPVLTLLQLLGYDDTDLYNDVPLWYNEDLSINRGGWNQYSAGSCVIRYNLPPATYWTIGEIPWHDESIY